MKRIVGGIGVVGAMALGLAACSHGTGASDSTAVTGASTTSTTLARAANAHIGQELIITHSKGYRFGVTVTQIIDPASSSTQPPAGSRLVAAQVSLDNAGSQSATGNLNTQLTVVGSDSHSYTSSSAPIQNCSNFNAGQYALNPGNVVTGCVAFQLPSSVTVATVKFIPNPGSVVGTWTNP
ncbi:MAG TPA: DUF4352 domain-containing protein [Acidimicrobiales bacterium]|jgi:hypothetical protein|nr:DUF4352 domain-containing protein [Acidimicrobiales bacterium]